MRTELVNTLLKAGIVSEEAVIQSIEHGLGTSLVERLLDLGYGSEDDVYKVIKNNMKLEVVEPKDIAEIDPRVFKVVPKGLIERHHFLPFYADSTSLHIAIIDPTQDSCMSEICFFTHLRVVPYGILASDLTKALNKYFGLMLPEEFKHKKVLKQEGSMTKDIPIPPPPKFPLPGKKPQDIPSAPPAAEGLPPLPGKEQQFPPLPNTKIEPPKAAEEPKPELPKKEIIIEKEEDLARLEEPKAPEPAQDLGGDIGVFDVNDDAEFRDISSNDVQVDNVLSSVPYEETQISEVQEEPLMPLDEAHLSHIASAETKEAVLDSVVKALKTISKSALVLFVKDDDMIAVAGFGEHIEGNTDDYKISLSAPNMFQSVFQNKTEFTGAPQSGYLNDMFFKRFGGFVPESIAIVPSVIEDVAFAAIYCEAPVSVDDMKRIASAMAGSFDRLLNSV